VLQLLQLLDSSLATPASEAAPVPHKLAYVSVPLKQLDRVAEMKQLCNHHYKQMEDSSMINSTAKGQNLVIIENRPDKWWHQQVH
jgi:hypothetical protein